MTYRMKKWQKLSTITLLMAGVITLNGGEFRSIDKHQIAVADTNVQTTDYEKLRNIWLDVNYGYDKYDENNPDMKKKFDAKEKEAKKKQKTIDVKEVRLSPNIDTNDLNTKVNAARKFLSKGDRVKVTLRFRGREMAHMASSRHVLDDFAKQLADVATVEKAPKVEGRSMTMFLTEKR